MGSLTGQSIPDSYDQLLTLPSGGGNTTTLVAVTDGDAETTFAIQLSSNAVYIPGTLTVGANTDGHDVKFFGNASGAYMLWDESEDLLELAIGTADGTALNIITTNNRNKDIVWAESGTTKGRIRFHNASGGDASDRLELGTSSDVDTMVIIGGKVGIGTAAPTAALHVVGSFAASGPSATFVTFTDGDTTPSVSTGNLFKHHASTETITMFDDGVIGQIITVISTAAITYDVTSTNLKGGSTDLVTANGESTTWIFDGTNWYLIGYMDLSQNYNVDGV